MKLEINFRDVQAEYIYPFDEEDPPELGRKWLEEFGGKVLIKAVVTLLPKDSEAVQTRIESSFFDPASPEERREATTELWEFTSRSIGKYLNELE